MYLLFLAFLPFLLVPFFFMAMFATVMMAFAVGAFLLRVLFFAAIAVLTGVGLLSLGAFGAGRWRSWKAWRSWQFRRGDDERRLALSGRATDADSAVEESGNSVFDDYRRATVNRLEDEAREFRTFLARLRHAADASDFQAFLNERRAGRP